MSIPTARHAVQVEDLRKTYSTGRGKPPVRALDGLSFTVDRGTVFGLLGPNGAGKSTTVRILSTLSRADSGRALVAGADVTREPQAVRQRIGLVSQKPSSDPIATGRENLVLAARLQGMTTTDARTRAGWLLDRFGLVDAADRLVRTWSGGMARKLDVAIGLVHAPQVLFLDEPTTGLDPQARAEMWSEITRMAGDDDITVVLTTHYLDEADRLAGRLAIVDQGRVVVTGTPDRLKDELRGDVVSVELGDPGAAGRARDQLAAVEGLSHVAVHGCTLRARSESGARVVPHLLAALDAAGIGVASATVARPSLDDVYLRHAGRVFEAVAS